MEGFVCCSKDEEAVPIRPFCPLSVSLPRPYMFAKEGGGQFDTTLDEIRVFA